MTLHPAAPRPAEPRTTPAAAKKLPWRSLTWQLFFLTILPLTALVLVVAFGSLTVHQNAMRDLVGERDERAVRTAAAALEEQISHRLLAVRSLALLAADSSPDELTAVLDTAGGLLPELDGGLAFFRTDGTLQARDSGPAPWNALADSLKLHIAGQTPAGSVWMPPGNIHTPPGSPDDYVVALAASPAGDWVAAGAFSARELVEHTLSETFASGPGAAVIVVGSEQQLLYQGGTFSPRSSAGQYPGVAEALGGASGTQYIMVGHEEHVVTYSPVKALGWALVLEEHWEMVESPTLRSSQLAPLVLVPVLILAIVALWFGARQIVRPLQTLEARAARLALGDFTAIAEPVGGIEEIRQLQQELIRMASQVQVAQQSLHGYIGAITAAQEEERRRLARELHDDTIQALIALKQRVQLSQLSAPGNGPAAAGLQEIALLAEQTIENLRRLIRALRPIYLEDLGLVTALEMLARETSQSLNIPVAFQRQGAERRLEANVELALYRMTQEACSNIARHAQAGQASVSIAFSPSEVAIQVSDNGRGFVTPKSPAEFASSGHYGLLGLHERAELIRAALEIQSAPGQGAQVTIRLAL